MLSRSWRLSQELLIIKCSEWSDSKASSGCIVSIYIVQSSNNNELINCPCPLISSRVRTVKYQSTPALVSPALMEEPATFSPAMKTISGIKNIFIYNRLTVFPLKALKVWVSGTRATYFRLWPLSQPIFPEQLLECSNTTSHLILIL